MKKTIISAIQSMQKFNEVAIFRAMETALNKRSQALYCQETHSRAGFVEYKSPNSKVPVVKEISDLMIVSFNSQTKETRLCFLQAKFHKKSIVPFLKFRGDFYQWELMTIRPTIKSMNNTHFPSNVLSFTKYKSITSFGVFYYDNNSKLDMLFTIPDLLSPRTIKKVKNRPATTLSFPGHNRCPCSTCFIAHKAELFATCNLDMFMQMLLSGQVGAPINSNLTIRNFVRSLALRVQGNQKIPLLTGIIASIQNDNSTPYEGPTPNILFVQSNGEYHSETVSA